MSASTSHDPEMVKNNKNMKWVNVTYERNVRHINKGKFLTSHDPEMVKRWLETTQKGGDCIGYDVLGDNFESFQKEDPDKIESDIDCITQSSDWEVVGHSYRLGNPEFVVDESYSGKGDLDDEIQSWIDTKRVDITSIYATGHDPLEIQEFLKEHQEIFNRMVTRKTIYDLKEDEGNLYLSLRELVGLENPYFVGSGRNQITKNSIFSGNSFYLKWKEKFEEDEEVEETCEVS
jgi:hypothetical protein